MLKEDLAMKLATNGRPHVGGSSGKDLVEKAQPCASRGTGQDIATVGVINGLYATKGSGKGRQLLEELLQHEFGQECGKQADLTQDEAVSRNLATIAQSLAQEASQEKLATVGKPCVAGCCGEELVRTATSYITIFGRLWPRRSSK